MPKTKSTNAPRIPHRTKRLPKSPTGGVELLLIQSVEHLGGRARWSPCGLATR